MGEIDTPGGKKTFTNPPECDANKKLGSEQTASYTCEPEMQCLEECHMHWGIIDRANPANTPGMDTTGAGGTIDAAFNAAGNDAGQKGTEGPDVKDKDTASTTELEKHKSKKHRRRHRDEEEEELDNDDDNEEEEEEEETLLQAAKKLMKMHGRKSKKLMKNSSKH